mgnify:CR=1 FL=1
MTKDLAKVIVEIRRELGFPDFSHGDIVLFKNNSYIPPELVKGKFISYCIETPEVALIQVAVPSDGYYFYDLAKKHWVEEIEKFLGTKLDSLGYYLWVEHVHLSLDYEEDIPSDT